MLNDQQNHDLTTAEGVTAFMEAATSESDWNRRCDQIKAAYGGGYPDFWFVTIVMGGVAARTSAKWGGDDQIRFTVLK